MKRRWIKRIAWIISTPILFFAVLIILLYIPPVQNFIRKEVTSYASEVTGLNIRIHRIDLRFPLNLLVRGVEVIQNPDTLLKMESLNVHIQAMPLLKGTVEIDDITLKQVAVNSANLIEGMKVEGVLGRFLLESHGVDISDESVIVNRAELEDTHVKLLLNDSTTTSEDTISKSSVNWKINLKKLKLSQVSFQMGMPGDSMFVETAIDEAMVEEALADLQKKEYALHQLRIRAPLTRYEIGKHQSLVGFDPSQVVVRDFYLGLDSLQCRGRSMKAIISECSLNERSGLSIRSLRGYLESNDTILSIPDFRLQTTHSSVDLKAHAYWKLLQEPDAGHLKASLNAYIGKEDVLLFAGGLPESFQKEYPFRPLEIHAGTHGNLKELQISGFTIDLPGAFSVKGGGMLENLADTLHRSATLALKMETGNLNFLTSLVGTAPGTLAIPDSMNLNARFNMRGSQYKADFQLCNKRGVLKAAADLNSESEQYAAFLKVDSLQLNHFLPRDSLYELSMSAKMTGKGFDFSSYQTVAQLDVNVDQLHYARYKVTDIGLKTFLNSGLARATLHSNNALLKMKVAGEYNVIRKYPDGKLSMAVEDMNLYKLGFLPRPLQRPFAFNLFAEARKDSLSVSLDSGDLKLHAHASEGVNELTNEINHFVEVLQKQLKEKELNHADLRASLPSATISFSAGKENPLSDYLSLEHISYHDALLRFDITPEVGINGKAVVHALKMDTLLLDTLYLTIEQDTSLMKFKGGVVNGPQHPQFSFTTTLTGEVRDKDAQLLVEYKNKQGETGVLLGINARPLFNENGKGDGMAFHVIPEEPIIAFRKFHFVDHNNWIYLHKNKRVYANVDMLDKEDMGFRVHSMEGDTVSLQNLDMEVRRIRLEEICSVIPYFPRITGLFSAEAHFLQTTKDVQISAESFVDELTYEGQRVGDVAIGVTRLPGEKGKQYLNAYLHHEGIEVLLADGKLNVNDGEKDSLEINMMLEHFPLHVANVFIPNELVVMDGDIDGYVNITGSGMKPRIDGKLMLDSVSCLSRQYGVRFLFDNRPILLKDSRLLFDKFAIYTTSKNPFIIDGNVDFKNIERPMALLNMNAENYTLLDAKRTRESLVYGKLLADIKAVVKGPLDGLNMRGNINLLGNTDVSYVLTDSPLTVQDRLGSLVTFTSFKDTTKVIRKTPSTVSLGGLDMIMMVHIDPSVRLKVDLDANSDDRVQLEGGGDLNLKYTPQGDMTLTGRYTLTGGLMKYALPVIAAKEFAIDNGSYVEWTGNPMDPKLNFKATDRIRATVSEGENGETRMVNFDVSIVVKNRLDNLSFAFDVSAPEDASIQNELTAMGAEERGKQALYIMVAKTYLGTGPIGGSGGMAKLNMGAALNSVLSSQINSLMGNLKNASVSVGIEDHDTSESGGKRTDYSFRYSQRFFNNRFQIVIGGKVSTGENVTNDAESFIDNISLEYRLDRSGTRYIRLFYDKNYESVLEGEITETGVGLVLRKKLDKLSELFIFRNKKKE